MSVGMYSRSYGSGDEGKKRPAGQEAPPVRREKQKKGAPGQAPGRTPAPQAASRREREKGGKPEPAHAAPPARQAGKGPLSRIGQMFEGLDTQDLLLIGLIFLLALEGADDDILFILIALLFISS